MARNCDGRVDWPAPHTTDFPLAALLVVEKARSAKAAKERSGPAEPCRRLGPAAKKQERFAAFRSLIEMRDLEQFGGNRVYK
jgi:hypothetical protein